MLTSLRYLLLLILLQTSLWGGTQSTTWYNQGTDKKVSINVELFLSSTCPHCHKADLFFKDLETKLPWLHVQRFVINEDKSALLHFNELLAEQKMSDFSVPSAFFCDSRWVGFDTAETTGKDLTRVLDYCKKQIEQNNSLTPTTREVLKRWANANFYDTGMVTKPSALYYIIAMGIIDAYNPCGLFCMMGFFALLFIVQPRSMQLLVTTIYLLTLGITHYFQQAFTSDYFAILPWLRLPAVGVGLLTLYLVYLAYKNRRTYPLLVLGSCLLALMTQFYQQTCLMNWSFLFEQWVHNQHYSKLTVGIYELAYQGIYFATLIVIALIYPFLNRFNYFSSAQAGLYRLGLLILTTMGLILIIYPNALSHLYLSMVILVIISVIAYILNKRKMAESL